MKKIITIVTLLVTITLGFNIYAQEVTLGGDSIGIKIDYDGVMVMGTFDFYDSDNKQISINKHLKTNDLIVEIDRKKITSLNDLYKITSTNKASYEVKLIRDNKLINSFIEQSKDFNDRMKTGLYLSESTQGIGTLTYYDHINRTYGALGHNVIDVNDLKGSIYKSSVISITKPHANEPGSKNASINYSLLLGDIDFNSNYGIFGSMNENSGNRKIDTSSDIKKGVATIFTVTNDNAINEYEIYINDFNLDKEIKHIEFIVTDKKLIEISGGIVQGMSGSPIVQNNKLIGAVSHVDMNESKKGYGLAIEHMIEESNKANSTLNQ